MFDLIAHDDPIRRDTEQFIAASESLRQHYRYVSPETPAEFTEALKQHQYSNLGDVFFATQLTTALFYDPMLPLIRRAASDTAVRRKLGRVFADYFSQSNEKPIADVPQFRHEVASLLDDSLKRHDLMAEYEGARQAGMIRPETLFFSAFGTPHAIDLV